MRDAYNYKQYLDDDHILDMEYYSGESDDEYENEAQLEFCTETIGELLKTMIKLRNTDSNTVHLDAYNIGWQAHSASKLYTVDTNDSDLTVGIDFIHKTFMHRYDGIKIYVKEIDKLYTTIHNNGFVVICHSHDCNMVISIS